MGQKSRLMLDDIEAMARQMSKSGGGSDGFEPCETRKKGIGIVPSVNVSKSKLDQAETKRVGLDVETPFGDFGASKTKSRDYFGKKDQNQLTYNYRRAFGKNKRNLAEISAAKSTGKNYGRDANEYNIQAKYRFEFGNAKGGFKDNRKKIDKAPPFGVINADDFKVLKEMKKASTGEFMTSRGGKSAIRGTKFKGVF